MNSERLKTLKYVLFIVPKTKNHTYSETFRDYFIFNKHENTPKERIQNVYKNIKYVFFMTKTLVQGHE